MNLIVKRRGHTESFDSRKLYASIYAACRSVEMKEIEAEQIAEMISKQIEKDISKAKAVSSDHLFKLAASHLKAHHPEASYMYIHHRDVS